MRIAAQLTVLASVLFVLLAVPCYASAFDSSSGESDFPPDLQSYNDAGQSISQRLQHRIEVHPFNLIGTLIFLLAIVNTIDLHAPLLVGFFLAGLVTHGGVQGWWIEPVLSSLTEVPLILVATGLTAFNDNAAITYLSTLVPGFTVGLKYAVVAGAVTGGGLTVIANAPNPAGQAILKKHFRIGVAPAGLFVGAFVPTVIMFAVFLVFR